MRPDSLPMTNGAELDFEGLVAALDEFLGGDVECSVWGSGPEDVLLVLCHGVLRRAQADIGEPSMPGTSPVGEEATLYQIGVGAELSLWPSRFVAATTSATNGVNAVTQDGRIRILRAPRRWID